MQIINSLFFLFLLILLYLVPMALTLINTVGLFVKMPFWERTSDLLTFLLGPVLMCLLWGMWSTPDWDQPLVLGGGTAEFHTILASWHMPTILALCLWALAGFFLLRFRTALMPPLPMVLCLSGVEVGLVLAAAFLVQMGTGLTRSGLLPMDGIYMALFPLNYILCSLRLLRRVVTQGAERSQAEPDAPQGALLSHCRRFLSHSMGWVLAGFLLALPLLAVLVGILVLLGQAPDAAVRAFTDTSDWTFSQQISPPPVEYQGHYLCTVAAGGHPGVVKPTRYGVRRGEKIVVNRQLCVANAFEQLIQERWPRFHRAVRRFYDEHGYPLSTKITTPLRADVTYVLMKPLEWVFLLALYTFDQRPENRIAMQYIGT